MSQVSSPPPAGTAIQPIQYGPNYNLVGSDMPTNARLWRKHAPNQFATLTTVGGLPRLTGVTAPSDHAAFYGYVLLGTVFPDDAGEMQLEAGFKNFTRPSDLGNNLRWDAGIQFTWRAELNAAANDHTYWVGYGGKSTTGNLHFHYSSLSAGGTPTLHAFYQDADVPTRFQLGFKVRFAVGTQTMMALDRIYCARDGFATMGDADMGVSSRIGAVRFLHGCRVGVGLIQVRTSAVGVFDVEYFKIVKGNFVPDLVT